MGPKHLPHTADRPRARIDQLCCAILSCRQHTGAITHIAMGEGRTVFDHQHPFAPDGGGIIHRNRHRRIDEQRPGVRLGDRPPHGRKPDRIGGVGLGEHDHVGSQQVGFAGKRPALVARPVRIDQHDVDRRLNERQIVVPPVPDDHVGFRLGLSQNPFVVHPGEHDRPRRQMRLVFFPFLDRATGPVEILQRPEPLYRLRREISVRHRMAENGGTQPPRPAPPGYRARERAFPRPGPHRTDGDHRLRRPQHGRTRPQ